MLERDEEGMIRAVFELNDKTAREIMVPRSDVVALSEDAGLRELVSVAATGRYGRYPVHPDGSPDRIVGAVHVKDVLRTIESEGGSGSRQDGPRPDARRAHDPREPP